LAARDWNRWLIARIEFDCCRVSARGKLEVIKVLSGRTASTVLDQIVFVGDRRIAAGFQDVLIEILEHIIFQND
jgi:hypothetical protein